MRDLIIHIEHPEIERISDRSARQVLKTLSTAVRQAQAAELRDLIFSLDVAYSQQQSLADRMDTPLKRTPSFHLQELRRGSMILTAAVSMAVLGVFVRKIVNEVIDDDDSRRQVLEQVRAHLEEGWHRSMLKRILGELRSGGLGARMEVKTCEIEENADRVRGNIIADTPLNEDGEPAPHSEGDTAESLTRYLDSQIAQDGSIPQADE